MLAQPGQAVVEGFAAAFDQAVGVEKECAAGRQWFGGVRAGEAGVDAEEGTVTVL